MQQVGQLPQPGGVLMTMIAYNRGMMAIVCMLALAGCSGKDVPIQPITIVGSDYCEIAEKIQWDLQDTKKTIDGVRRHNAKWDAKCGKGAKPTS